MNRVASLAERISKAIGVPIVRDCLVSAILMSGGVTSLRSLKYDRKISLK